VTTAVRGDGPRGGRWVDRNGCWGREQQRRHLEGDQPTERAERDAADESLGGSVAALGLGEQHIGARGQRREQQIRQRIHRVREQRDHGNQQGDEQQHREVDEVIGVLDPAVELREFAPLERPAPAVGGQ